MSNELSDKLLDLAHWFQSSQGELALRQPDILANLENLQKLLRDNTIDKPSKIPEQGVTLIEKLLEQKEGFESQYERLQKDLASQCKELQDDFPKLAQLLTVKGRQDPQQATALFNLLKAK